MKQLFTNPVNTFRVLAVSAIVMAGSTATHAQVKVGANPAIITANSVLDVEGTSAQHTVILQNGNMGVNQAAPTNKLHIKDATDPVRVEGMSASTNSADKGVVVDASGVLKIGKNSESSLGTAIYLKLGANSHIPAANSIHPLTFNSVIYNSGDFTYSNGEITFAKGGTYVVFSQMSFGSISANEQLLQGVIDSNNKWIARATHYAASATPDGYIGECFFATYPITVTAGQRVKNGCRCER